MPKFADHVDARALLRDPFYSKRGNLLATALAVQGVKTRGSPASAGRPAS